MNVTHLGQLWSVFFMVIGVTWGLYGLNRLKQHRTRIDGIARLNGVKGIAVTSLHIGQIGYARVGSDIWPVSLQSRNSSIAVGQWVRVVDILNGKVFVSGIDE